MRCFCCLVLSRGVLVFFFKQKTAYEMRISDWSSDVCSSDLGWPVVLVVDCQGMGTSVAALARGFAAFHAEVALAGVILNNVASARHEGLLSSEERRVGKECVSTCRSRRSPSH